MLNNKKSNVIKIVWILKLLSVKIKDQRNGKMLWSQPIWIKYFLIKLVIIFYLNNKKNSWEKEMFKYVNT